MTKTDRHRTALACVAGGCHAGGRFRWSCFPCVHAIAHVYMLQPVALEMVWVCVIFLLHNMAIFDSCMFQILIGPRVRSLLFHMLVLYWHTCHVAARSRVTSSLDHVLYFYWSIWLFLIRPRITALFVHVLHFYSATWLDDILPRGIFLIAHVLCSGYFMCHALVPPRVAVLVLSRGVQSIRHRSNLRSSLLHRLTT